MLAAGGRASPFGDLAKCATAAGADFSRGFQFANVLARRCWALGHNSPQSRLCASRKIGFSLFYSNVAHQEILGIVVSQNSTNSFASTRVGFHIY